jgi:isocitrate/isopropylmalate dehydrogenase
VPEHEGSDGCTIVFAPRRKAVDIDQRVRPYVRNDKANILEVLTGLFFDTAREVGEAYRDRIEIEDRIVDNCAMQLVLNPWRFNVI